MTCMPKQNARRFNGSATGRCSTRFSEARRTVEDFNRNFPKMQKFCNSLKTSYDLGNKSADTDVISSQVFTWDGLNGTAKLSSLEELWHGRRYIYLIFSNGATAWFQLSSDAEGKYLYSEIEVQDANVPRVLKIS